MNTHEVARAKLREIADRLDALFAQAESLSPDVQEQLEEQISALERQLAEQRREYDALLAKFNKGEN